LFRDAVNLFLSSGVKPKNENELLLYFKFASVRLNDTWEIVY
jgi:hypothetical protein